MAEAEANAAERPAEAPEPPAAADDEAVAPGVAPVAEERRAEILPFRPR